MSEGELCDKGSVWVTCEGHVGYSGEAVDKLLSSWKLEHGCGLVCSDQDEHTP